MRVISRYRLEEDQKDLDERLLEAVFEELERVRPDWLRFEAYRLDDGVTVVSVIDVDDPSQLRRLVEFSAYTETLDARCTEPPVTDVVEQLGGYRPPAGDRDDRIRAGLEQHWAASERGDIETEHAIYADEAILDFPQSGERFRGRSTIRAQRGGYPADRHVTVLRISGGGDRWASECAIAHDGVPSYSISVAEFTGDLLTHETRYFADPFPAAPSRAALAERIPDDER